MLLRTFSELGQLVSWIVKIRLWRRRGDLKQEEEVLKKWLYIGNE